MSWITDILKTLSRKLYPLGRAFKMPPGGTFDRLDTALNLSDARAYNDAVSLLDSILPDNVNFTADDATRMEREYAINSTSGTSLADRKLAIIQKIAYPGTVAPRCAYDYLQAQLRLAGFDVYVYENIFSPGPVTKTPNEVLGIPILESYLGGFYLGDAYLGTTSLGDGVSIIANYIEESKDALFVVAPDYRSTFYISSNVLTTFATVPLVRKAEFRQLILQLKPQQTAGFLFITYT